MLSKSVADALSLEGDPTLCETEKFVRNFDRFFDCMNVRSLKEGQYKRKPDLRPYRSASDPRLTVSYNVISIAHLITESFSPIVA